MHKTALLLCLLIAPAVPAKDTAAKDTPAKQFVDQTWVDVPRQAGPFSLVGTKYDPAQFAYGVSTRWKAPNAPDSLVIDLFVYPLGQAEEAEAVKRSMDEVDAGIAEYAKRGVYTQVQTGARTPFVVVRPESSAMDDGKTPRPPLDPIPKEEVVVEPSAEAAGDPMMQALAESMGPRNSHGLRETIQLEHDGVPTRSAAFAFHRHLYLFKLRVSVPASDMAQEDFERVADDAARQLVPRVDVLNFGECGNITLDLPPGGKKKQSKAEQEKEASEGAAQLIRGIARIKRDNCAGSPGQAAKPAEGVERVVVSYPEGTWK